jgi:hypothetical protein
MNREELLRGYRRPTDERIEDKERIRANLASDVEAFLAAGGVAQEVKMGASGLFYDALGNLNAGGITRRYGSLPAVETTVDTRESLGRRVKMRTLRRWSSSASEVGK